MLSERQKPVQVSLELRGTQVFQRKNLFRHESQRGKGGAIGGRELVLGDLRPERIRTFFYKQVQAVTMPGIDELLKRLKEMIDEGRENPLNDFTVELSNQVRELLKREVGGTFPRIALHLRDGESYRESLRAVGVPLSMIEGSQGQYLGNRLFAQIFVDLGSFRQYVLEGHPESGMVHLCAVLIEEYSHALSPDVSDLEMVEKTITLNEKFLGFKYTEDEKKAMREYVARGPKDGLFTQE